jgi:hypothetical protein
MKQLFHVIISLRLKKSKINIPIFFNGNTLSLDFLPWFNFLFVKNGKEKNTPTTKILEINTKYLLKTSYEHNIIINRIGSNSKITLLRYFAA